MIAPRIYTITMMVLLLGLLCSCEREAQKSEPTGIQISGAGATFPAPVYKRWIEEYRKTHEDVVINYQAVGSGEGTKRFINQEVDFGASDAALNDEQIAKIEGGVKLIPVTAGIIVLAYNLKELNGSLRLPRDVYVAIFSGAITFWNDPRIKQANPGLNLPSKGILLVARQDSSGTTFAFTNHLSAVNKEWRDRGPGVGKVVQWPANAMTAHGNEGVAGRIKISEGAIGYVEYGFATRAGLPMAWLENKAGKFVEPVLANGEATLANTQAEIPQNLRMFFPDPPGPDSYPLVTYSWLLLYGKYSDPQKGAAVKDFVKWGIDEGQRYAEPLGYCRVPSEVVGLANKAIEEIK
ncbi:MAG: phosphate ABC transporter substrate-binding protein PstS [Desulfomonilaceae bacterium]